MSRRAALRGHQGRKYLSRRPSGLMVKKAQSRRFEKTVQCQAGYIEVYSLQIKASQSSSPDILVWHLVGVPLYLSVSCGSVPCCGDTGIGSGGRKRWRKIMEEDNFKAGGFLAGANLEIVSNICTLFKRVSFTIKFTHICCPVLFILLKGRGTSYLARGISCLV